LVTSRFKYGHTAELAEMDTEQSQSLCKNLLVTFGR